MNKAEFSAILSLLETLNIDLKSGDYRCVVEALSDEYKFDDNKNRCFTTSENCGECISRWIRTAEEAQNERR
jgi:hypothetical protein